MKQFLTWELKTNVFCLDVFQWSEDAFADVNSVNSLITIHRLPAGLSWNPVIGASRIKMLDRIRGLFYAELMSSCERRPCGAHCRCIIKQSRLLLTPDGLRGESGGSSKQTPRVRVTFLVPCGKHGVGWVRSYANGTVNRFEEMRHINSSREAIIQITPRIFWCFYTLAAVMRRFGRCANKDEPSFLCNVII